MKNSTGNWNHSCLEWLEMTRFNQFNQAGGGIRGRGGCAWRPNIVQIFVARRKTPKRRYANKVNSNIDSKKRGQISVLFNRGKFDWKWQVSINIWSTRPWIWLHMSVEAEKSPEIPEIWNPKWQSWIVNVPQDMAGCPIWSPIEQPPLHVPPYAILQSKTF